jgi:hypothetical protein
LTRGVAFAWPAAVAAVAAASTAAVGASALAPASTLSAPSALRSRLGGGRPLELHPASALVPRPSSPPATPAPFPAPTSISALSGSLSRSTSGVYLTPPAAVTSRTISRANEGRASMCQDAVGAPRDTLSTGRFPAPLRDGGAVLSITGASFRAGSGGGGDTVLSASRLSRSA